MSDVSALGLGQMGSALARSLVKAGHHVTVWNRSPVKVQPLVELGAAGVGRVAAAVASSPVLLVCVDSYQTTRAMFESRDVLEELSGRAVVQLSTGSPREAREREVCFTS